MAKISYRKNITELLELWLDGQDSALNKLQTNYSSWIRKQIKRVINPKEFKFIDYDIVESEIWINVWRMQAKHKRNPIHKPFPYFQKMIRSCSINLLLKMKRDKFTEQEYIDRMIKNYGY